MKYPMLLMKTLGSLRGMLAACAVLLAGQALGQVQGVTDTEIVLGSHVDLSGPLSSMGAPFRDGMIFATEEINAGGGINGRKIRMQIEDNGYDPKKGILATQKLLTQDKVFAFVSTLGTAPSIASMPLALDRGIPFLFPGAASEATYVPHHPLKFAITSPFSVQWKAAVKYAYEVLGKRRFGILYQDDETGQSIIRAVDEQLKVHGLTLVEKTSHKRGEIDFASQVARLKVANVDIILLGTNVREVAGAAIEARKLNWPVDLIASSGASSLTTINLGGRAVEGLYVTTQFPNSAQEATPALIAIKERYKARFGYEYQDGVNQGYTAVMLFAEGAKNAGRNLTPQTLAQGLEKVKNFQNVFAGVPISYGPDNHLPPQSAIILKVKDGKFVMVSGG
ncbi:MAG: ABC transporter substrate-binding protein [Sulfuricaulis sp.]|nr:ABC transporter substrate-binding protein [Sulfuricaulis sp.]